MSFIDDFNPDKFEYLTSIHELIERVMEYPDTECDALIDGTIQLSYRPRAVRGRHNSGLWETWSDRMLYAGTTDDGAKMWLDDGVWQDADRLTAVAHKLIEQVTPAPGFPEVRQARGAQAEMETSQRIADTARAERDTAIRAAHAAGMSMYRIAQELDMPQSTVRKIVNAA